MAATGFKFVVERLGPELPDDGNGGIYSSFAAPPAPLGGGPLNAAGAGAQAAADLAASDLNDEYGLSGGAFDTANEILMDPSGEGDWLVPYKRGSDYTGALLIDAETGVIEQATWLESGETPFQLSDLDDMYAGLYADFIPNDNLVPEPGTVALALLGVALFVVRRRRA
ncbi:MAG: PEP-CTERM sorting domain-containing protein [Pedosphaera sp.]|nr:PEP-CTERM sorting domain-containing protein [Pedosphaera sp.]